ncbi:unnamed protein product [Oikopleura dioica]|uniref:Uncharacterized protein n=1 Tax=Oikopleura dioica TaxID=34765 RepID=E4YJT2_OIKDI|nr:unnamed protein product [Oikopleura dioica]
MCESMPSYMTPSDTKFFFGPVNKGQFQQPHLEARFWNPFFDLYMYINDHISGLPTDDLLRVRVILQSSEADPYSIDASKVVLFNPEDFSQSRAFLLKDVFTTNGEALAVEVKHSAIMTFHEDNYQHLLREGKNTHQITDFEEHLDLSPKIESAHVKAMLREEFAFIKELVHTICTRRKRWKLFDPLCEVDESYAFLKYNFYPRTTRKVTKKFKMTLNKIIDKHFTLDFEMQKFHS